jgi:hypothetical protein
MRPLRTAIVLTLAGGVLLATPASAHAPRRAQVLTHLQVGRVCTSGSAIDVSYSLEDLIGREWTFRQDRGDVTVQLHFLGGRNGPTGQAWVDVESASGGEGHRRVSRLQPFFDSVRVVRAGVASSGRPVEGPCS